METYINRDYFLEEMRKQYCDNCERRKGADGTKLYAIGDAPCRACGIGDILDEVETFYDADVSPVAHGEWIKGEKVRPDYTRDSDYFFHCSLCGHADIHNEHIIVPCCWHCGAKME